MCSYFLSMKSARYKRKAKRANSVGSNEKKPKFIHLIAPLILTPKPKYNAIRKTMARLKKSGISCLVFVV